MKKYKKLLESEVPEDIATGLYLCNEEGLLEYVDFKTKCKLIFVINFQDYTIWIVDQYIKIRPMNNQFDYRFVSGINYYKEFDFRTKKEE